MISYVLMNAICGKFKKITPAMYILAVLFILKFIFIWKQNILPYKYSAATVLMQNIFLNKGDLLRQIEYFSKLCGIVAQLHIIYDICSSFSPEEEAEGPGILNNKTNTICR